MLKCSPHDFGSLVQILKGSIKRFYFRFRGGYVQFLRNTIVDYNKLSQCLIFNLETVT